MLKKVRKKSCKRPFIQIRNWVCSLSSVQVLRKSIQGFLCNPPDKPTNQQTNVHRRNHAFLGGGSKC